MGYREKSEKWNPIGCVWIILELVGHYKDFELDPNKISEPSEDYKQRGHLSYILKGSNFLPYRDFQGVGMDTRCYRWGASGNPKIIIGMVKLLLI